MKKSFLSAFIDQQCTVPPVVTADLTDQTILVVGANVGIGFEAAKHFARMNPRKLIMACRNERKGKDAIKELEQETGYERVELRLVDLASFASVTAFAEKFSGEQDTRLDILVMNAGVVMGEYGTTEDGWETTLQVNHLATALLSLLLFPHLSKSSSPEKPSRLVIVSSDMHYMTKVTPEIMESSSTTLRTLSSEEYSNRVGLSSRYTESKLLNVFFVRALAAHLARRDVTPVAVNPGFCYSQLRRSTYSQPLKNFFMVSLEKVMAWTTEQGGRQLVYAAIGGREDEGNIWAGYVSRGGVVEVSDFVLSEKGAKMQAKVWDETIQILSSVSDRVGEIGKEYFIA
ncbi:hypothetical protein BJ138DRAFT_160175 [Hygrophoropsis aurantiaca]|uniref:Uncharacterized protein n=1 Tax=Hygrophoropsis aurantiaca TaxID=72124 RepID=A0ACB8A9S0_9AGAM|nr:hypothetical protein BJ138DRAFT_160175 [Hygrophoropsis aurantiaca]